MTTLQKLKGRWRLFWNVCPACNSDAPECDTCTVCMDWHGKNRPAYPPPVEEKNSWWKRFLGDNAKSGVTRVEQRTNTDCLRCCLAMTTGIVYEDVPDFTPFGENWTTGCEDWLRGVGAGLVMFSGSPRYIPPWLPVIAQGPTSYSEHPHCVVVTADAVIDPHPSQKGILTVEHVFAVIKQNGLSLTNHENRETTGLDDTCLTSSREAALSTEAKKGDR